VDHLVDGFFAKDGRDADGFFRTAHLPIGPGRHAVFVDDRPEDLDQAASTSSPFPLTSATTPSTMGSGRWPNGPGWSDPSVAK
jgi:hypothetical protein